MICCRSDTYQYHFDPKEIYFWFKNFALLPRLLNRQEYKIWKICRLRRCKGVEQFSFGTIMPNGERLYRILQRTLLILLTTYANSTHAGIKSTWDITQNLRLHLFENKLCLKALGSSNLLVLSIGINHPLIINIFCLYLIPPFVLGKYHLSS